MFYLVATLVLQLHMDWQSYVFILINNATLTYYEKLTMERFFLCIGSVLILD